MCGIIALFTGCSSLLGPILAKFIIQEKTDYLILFLIGGSLNIVSFVLNFFFTEERFDYGLKKSEIISEAEKFKNEYRPTCVASSEIETTCKD